MLVAFERSYEFLQRHVTFGESVAVFVVCEMFYCFGSLDSHPQNVMDPLSHMRLMSGIDTTSPFCLFG